MNQENRLTYEELLRKFNKLEKDYKESMKQLSELRRSDNASHTIIYKYIPISIWEEDFSDVFAYLKSLKFQEIEDFRQYLDLNPEIVYESLKKVKILDLNDHSAKLYGLKNKNELIDRFVELFSDSTFEAFKKELVAMHQGLRYLEMDAEITDIDGIRHDIFLQWIVLPGYETNYEKIMITTIDVSEIKQAERERFKLLEQFQQKQKLESLGLFASGIAHDFNNILFGIRGHAELGMTDLPSNHTSYQYLEKIVELVNKGSQITNQILSFAGKITQTREILNLNLELIKEKELFRVFLDNTTEIELNLTDEDIFIELNLGHLNQIILNLVANSAYAVKNRIGKISIMTEIVSNTDNEELVLLKVRDNGIGISNDNLKKIFDPFYTSKDEGRGLGLSVVHGIINSYNGIITVNSELGVFAEFVIQLPLAKKKAKNM